MNRTIHRILMGVVVTPFVAFGWMLSVWLSHQAVQASERESSQLVQTD